MPMYVPMCARTCVRACVRVCRGRVCTAPGGGKALQYLDAMTNGHRYRLCDVWQTPL